MIKYLQFVIYSESTYRRVPEVWLENLKEYTTDKEKVVYWIPENSPEYDYAKGLCSRNLRDIVVEVTGSVIETDVKEYDPKDDCSFVEPWIIVSKEVYEVMTSFISNKNFFPILNKR